MTAPSKSILIIPDSHARPDQDNTRFDALGQFIVDKRPDIIVDIGDRFDMGSLCSYDKGQRIAEGRRYAADIEAGNDSLRRTMEPVRRAISKAGKRGKWHPEFHVTLGNHEHRIDRATQYSPELHGKLSTNDFDFKKWGFTVHPFLKPLKKQGILFQHYFTSGVMGKPIGGVNHARTLVLKNYQSSVCGHSHARDYYEDVRGDGQRVFGLVVGCFDEGDHHYTTEQRRWWSGLVVLNEAWDGSAEPAFWSMDYLKRKYT